MYMERFNLKKLNEAEGKEQRGVEISNSFAAVENLGGDGLRIELGKLLERILKCQPKIAYVIMN
jgi:hypothetical protein